MHANTDHNYGHAHGLVPKIGSCAARARPLASLNPIGNKLGLVMHSIPATLGGSYIPGFSRRSA